MRRNITQSCIYKKGANAKLKISNKSALELSQDCLNEARIEGKGLEKIQAYERIIKLLIEEKFKKNE